MKNHDILWTTTDRTARDLGPVLFKYKHVMQLMELIYDIPYFPRQKIIQSNIKKYAKKAYKVVVPEYNRAQIPFISDTKSIYWNFILCSEKR